MKMNKIPYGYCQCGCGQKTRIAERNRARLGWSKGEPLRFLQGHYAKIQPPNAERFWSKVDQSENEDACWNWTAKSHSGYGQFHVGGHKGRKVQAHRFSYELSYGSIPDGLFVLHKCDNRACVNPKHLFLGTQLDNMRDMTNKGRHGDSARRGEQNGNHKLTNGKVLYIRERFAMGDITKTELARQMGVHRKVIWDIINGKLWRDI